MQSKAGLREAVFYSILPDGHITDSAEVTDFSFNFGLQVVPECAIIHILHDKVVVIVLICWSVAVVTNKFAKSFTTDHTTEVLYERYLRHYGNRVTLQAAF